MTRLLVINPGGTSTRLAYFKDHKQIFSEILNHDANDMKMFSTSVEQLDFRLEQTGKLLNKWNISMNDIDTVVGRGAPLCPLPAGVYEIDQDMIDDIVNGNILADHPSLLGALMADKLTSENEKKAYIVDPVCVDEMWDIARISGIKDIRRVSLWHALNSRYVAKKACEKHGLDYNKSKLVVAHLGSGISISAHVNGKAVDVNNANEMGPFSPQRAGALPVSALVKMCFDSGKDKKELLSLMTKSGGLVNYLGTSDLRKIEKMIEDGNAEAETILLAMIYQIAKEIGSMYVACGMADMIVISGGIAHSGYVIEKLTDRIKQLAKIEVFPGEMEMQALASGTLEVIEGKAKVLNYKEAKSKQ